MSPEKIVAVSGASGLVGSAICLFLKENASTHLVLLKRKGHPENPEWYLTEDCNPDTIIHLAGAPISRYWSPSYKKILRGSRIQGTKNLVRLMASWPEKERSFITASAVGFYGDQGERKVTLSSSPGDDFLSLLAQDWENAAKDVDPKTRWIALRFGLIFSQKGGVFPELKKRLYAGARTVLGSGEQFWPLVALEDVVRLIYHCTEFAELSGPINVAPIVCRQKELVAKLMKHYKLKIPLWLPRPLIKLLLGDMSQLFLDSVNLQQESIKGFEWQYSCVESLLASCSIEQ